MKRTLTAAGIIACALAALAAAGVLLYRHFVTDRIMDGGDMTNPFLTQEGMSRLLPEDGEFVSLLWVRNAMRSDDCYRFFLSGGPDAAAFECSAADESGGNGDRLELGGDVSETGEVRCAAPISHERWQQVERMLRETSLPVYQSPDPNLSDAETNRISIVWRQKDGTESSAAFDGTDADPLLELFREIAKEAAVKT